MTESDKIKSHLDISTQEAIYDLTSLAKEVSAESLLAAYFSQVFAPPEHLTEANFGTIAVELEILAYYLIPYFGVSQNHRIDARHIPFCEKTIKKIMAGHGWGNYESSEVGKLQTHIDIENKFVRGTAYPEQTKEEIIDVFGRYEKWFVNKGVLGPKRVIEILYSIKSIIESNFHKLKQSQQQILIETYGSLKSVPDQGKYDFFCGMYSESINYLPASFEDVSKNDDLLSIDEWNKLISMFGFTIERRNQMENLDRSRYYPLYIFQNSRILYIDLSHTFDLLWDYYESIIKTDNKLFEKYNRHKTEWFENKVKTCLARIFPSQNILTNALYSNPDKEGHETEIDFIIDYEPFLLLIECKARQFRKDIDNMPRIRTDIERNVKDGLDQAERAFRYIESSTHAVFSEKNSEKKFVINKCKYKKVYIVTISQHFLSGIASDLKLTKCLGLFNENEYPLSMCLADIDIISHFCEFPEVFVHYIEKRNEWQNHNIVLSHDELDIFSLYLSNRSFQFSNDEGEVSLIGGWTDCFDEWIRYRRGELQTKPDIKIDLPVIFSDLIVRLGNSIYNNRWLIFCLLDLPMISLEHYSRAIVDLKAQQFRPKCFRRMAFQDNDTTVLLFATSEYSVDLLSERMKERLLVEKYRKKTYRAIGLGINVNSIAVIECASIVEGDWVYDVFYEKKLAEDKPMISNGKLPRRNDLCFCGSGKKFKKCCISLFEQ